MEILDAGDREEEREDGEEISFLDKFWSESEHEECSAESWYQRWYTNATDFTVTNTNQRLVKYCYLWSSV